MRIYLYKVLILFVLLLFGFKTVEDADWSSKNNWLTFWTNWDGNYEVYVVKTNGEGLKNLSNHISEDANPVWSPDGKRIAFFSFRDDNAEIYIMNADGSDLINVSQHESNDFNPSWSPDGKSLAFTSNRNGKYQIFIIDLKTKAVKNISNSIYNEGNPDWSNDGNRILYVSSRKMSRVICVMDIDGKNQRVLIENKFMDYLNPKWSPNDTSMVFHSLFEDAGRDRGGIYKMQLDSNNTVKLTTDEYYNYNPFFSPDGKHISYNVSDKKGVINIYTMRSDGSNKKKITNKLLKE